MSIVLKLIIAHHVGAVQCSSYRHNKPFNSDSLWCFAMFVIQEISTVLERCVFRCCSQWTRDPCYSKVCKFSAWSALDVLHHWFSVPLHSLAECRVPWTNQCNVKIVVSKLPKTKYSFWPVTKRFSLPCSWFYSQSIEYFTKLGFASSRNSNYLIFITSSSIAVFV